MKEVKTQDAIGLILCHDITRIIPGVGGVKDVAFSKGHVVREEDIPALLALGKENLYVWSDEPGMIHENEAAEILCELAAGDHISGTKVKEGKIELIADEDGLLRVDKAKLVALNRADDFMMATRHDYSPVRRGDVLAGMRAIPLAVSRSSIGMMVDAVWAERGGGAGAEEEGGAGASEKGATSDKILNIIPYEKMRAGIVTTGSEVYGHLVEDGFTPKVRKKMAEYGMYEAGQVTVPDDPGKTTAAILKLISEKGADIVFVTGGMSVDPDDRTPLAIRDTGAEVVSYGASALPGAMFMLAYFKRASEKTRANVGAAQRGIPILGLPGCVMHDERTVLDILLPRLVAGVAVTKDDIVALCAGGLCLRCETCIFPRCGFGAV
ncbi:MAG: molybdopterin-binding protein [Clostridiales Family XIII bacterium]|jgi:molybdopterin biosynthesis enzyme MoaB|nr:molybdopterin-binding protein [Clostridiales Family XIII bacterium]